MQRTFVKYLLLFFLPVVAVNVGLELYVRAQPSLFKLNAKYLEKAQKNIQVVAFGSSQIKDAINPEWVDAPLLNMASGDQHHDTDFKLLKGLIDRLPELKTVLFEVSYSHFELPHNGPDFWKNSAYLHYYNINTFERPTWFKDRLLFLSNPPFFSKRFSADSLANSSQPEFNQYGFDANNYFGPFRRVGFDSLKIEAISNFKINTAPNLTLFEHNVALFEELVAYARAQDLEVIIIQAPMYRTYHPKKQADILRRRDSVVNRLVSEDLGIRLFDLEQDTSNYHVTDFWNQSHLNPNGARKFSRSLDLFLKASSLP